MRSSKQLGMRGFSLVEIAIALVVISLLAGSLMKAFQLQLAFGRSTLAREQLREAREALLNYAVVNQRLPCPASDSSGIAQTSCSSTPKGWLPWQELGLPARDAWGQTLRYAVSTAMSTSGFGLGSTGSLQLYQGSNRMNNDEAVAFVVWSIGSDGHDASSGSNAVVTVESPSSDDLVEWVSRYLLFGKMLAAGRSLSFGAGP
ncbi:type II secretion system protein [Uliginosibacterium sediminicola]|uniref:Type II secretion system protein n=1 Tax=Uliginosibacterium sediminicola TaxID=2024550 RepID=A0ABU9YVL8_9RHOO